MNSSFITSRPGDDFDKVVIRNNLQEFYTNHHQLPTINNFLSVLKTDITSTIYQIEINKKQYHYSKNIQI